MISSYRGVSWNKKNKAWQARIRYGRDVLSLGYFDCDKRAAQAFDIMSLRIHKDLAKTNFPFGNYDRRIFEDRPLSEVVYLARALSRKRRRSGDDEQEREWERVALEACMKIHEGTLNASESDHTSEGRPSGELETENNLGGLLQAAEVTSLREKNANLMHSKESLELALQFSQAQCLSVSWERDQAIAQRDQAIVRVKQLELEFASSGFHKRSQKDNGHGSDCTASSDHQLRTRVEMSQPSSNVKGLRSHCESGESCTVTAS
uniref:AP2/ERF domain-containing protein n=1 Tax=Rhodosorus marinus TaxID=101924 RepID=A0A7S0G2A6_9RHOD|mmetsp:Transcript_16588/g.23938  ORF Transcript_16588/g.23938 Transcript_16588/m.23938 type:complete len:263 (+) Transcript_16588:321-1109(+)